MLVGLLSLSGANIGAAAAAFLARTSGLDATHTNAYIALINGLVGDGIWSKLDMLHVYATQNSTTALLNLVSSSYNGTANGSPTFATDLGFTGVDSSATVYIDSNFNPATAGGQYAQDSAHISVWSLTNAASSANGGIMIGLDNSDTIQSNIFPKYNTGSALFRVNGPTSSSASVANSDSRGHYIANRSSSTDLQGYKNGSSICTASSNTSSALVSNNYYILARDGFGAPSFGGGYQTAMASIGSSLSGTDSTNFYNRLRTYMTAVGVP